MLKKRLIFTLLVDGDNFVLSRNFNLQKVVDINWLLDNYNFSNVSKSLCEGVSEKSLFLSSSLILL